MRLLITLITLTTMFQRALPQETYSVPEGTGKLAIEVYRQLAKENNDNILFSPYSLNMAMGITYSGANGKTKEQIASTFGFPLEDKFLLKELSASQNELNMRNKKGIEIAIVNQLWADSKHKFRNTYLSEAEKAFSAPIKTLDFRSKPDESRVEINRWAESNTKARIKDLLPKGSISHLTALVITNAIYFKGQWDNKFEEANTSHDVFYSIENKKIECMMMNKQGNFNYLEEEGFQLLELPYAGKAFSMIILLPNEGVDFNEAEANLSYESLSGHFERMSPTDVKIMMPKFKFDSKYEFKNILSRMGMPIAFTNAADFTRMSEKSDLKIDQVYHKAFIEVNEEGTEAAAATAVVVVRKSISIPVDFIANRPFQFFIRDNSSGNILFIGRVMNPK